MTKIKKLKRRKRFRANVNRKRLRNKLNKLPNIECKQIKESWEATRSTIKNLTQMGLAYDPNDVLKVPSLKQTFLETVKNSQQDESETENVEENVPNKLYVAQSLEKEARHPRAKLFRLPNNEVQFATYMMDKYGDDYKAMVRDRKNYNQLTWRQIKAKINRLKSIPEQYAEYLVKTGEIVLSDPTPLKNPKKLKPLVLQEPVEKKNGTRLSRRKRQKNKNLFQTVWQEESILEDGSNNEIIIDQTVSDNKEDSNKKLSSDKKLYLFPDDDDNDKTNGDLLKSSGESENEEESEKKLRITRKKYSKSNKIGK
ncbi:nucleolar protein 16 [Phymastichus coffea]|uniref:nucleolar protein 16 n=1 Tax=Phymastichus coffea TaxID=108790 RepID=UPI00273B8338|nr:nucleolar protein 16 [Phymastichus coffea]XP_058809050.1 nucleolar protein 16 [Phymastichus coffea]